MSGLLDGGGRGTRGHVDAACTVRLVGMVSTHTSEPGLSTDQGPTAHPAAPGRSHVQIAERPEEHRYLWAGRALTRHRGGWGEPGKTFAIGLGWEIHRSPPPHLRRRPRNDVSAATHVGMGCRACERRDCPQRAESPLGRPLRSGQDLAALVFSRGIRKVGNGSV
ncbi:hypothetical protein E5082_22165 [Streptomyces griseoluteus]|uniref:Short-chain fatty acyl coenzyme A regulators C-terminal domain-containing protein n=2 Tax=Streptomyces griseoluteus TaxID=29306 RepID=A0A4Z1DCJ5_STRGP|nr:hypothetical protein E5082_22165 [Streptomyces griseoluteus]